MIDIIYEDQQFVVCNKPSGTISEYIEGNENSLPYILTKEKDYDNIFVVHRLDKDVSGIIVYARTSSAAAFFSEQIAKGNFKKEYIAITHGKPEKDSDELCDLLFHDKGKNKTYIVDRERKGVKKAKLEYQLLMYCEKSDRSMLKIRLYTGRTHQIRVQLGSRKLPICGDRKYGSSEKGKNMLLHSYKTRFIDPSSKKEISFVIDPKWKDLFNNYPTYSD